MYDFDDLLLAKCFLVKSIPFRATGDRMTLGPTKMSFFAEIELKIEAIYVCVSHITNYIFYFMFLILNNRNHIL